MDIKTLMIGDWVYNKHHGKNIRLTPYDFFTHTHNEFGGQRLVPYATPTIGLDLEPIPLTPEILEKNGFYGGEYKHYCGNVWHLELGGFREIGFTYSNGKGVLWGEKIKSNYPTSIGDKFVIPNITCLHVLQHALRLCGISKEIEL